VFTAVTAAVAFGAIPAEAGEVHDQVELRWLAPEPCPSRDEFLAALAQMLGYRVTSASPLFATVIITQISHDSFRLTLTTKFDRVSGQRVLQGKACHVVADAAAVTLALLLNPALDVTTVPDTSEEPAVSEPIAAPAAAVAAKPISQGSSVPVPARPSDWYGLLSSQVGVQLGVLPKVDPQFSLGLAIGRDQGSLWATASFGIPQSAPIAPPNVGGRLWTASLGVQGCWLWATRFPRLGTCLGAETTRLQGRGTGVTEVRSAATTWISPSLSAHADFALNRRTWFRVSAAALVPLARPDTHLDEIGTVQRPAKLVGKLDTGLVVSF
jgi:hypothetical protein